MEKSRLNLLSLLFILFALAVSAYSLHIFPKTLAPTVPANVPLGEKIRLGVVPPPPMSTSTRERLAESKGFQHLESYTDTGFEPAHLEIQRGQTVRFANNSSSGLWVAAGGAIKIYPKTGNMCGSSDLDSCTIIPPQDFWEFTFEKAGRWQVLNNLDKTKEVIIDVL